MNFFVCALLSPKVEISKVLEESAPRKLSSSGWQRDTYSGKLKNSGINSLTSPLISFEADSYAFLTSL